MRPVLLNSCARATTAAEARFRIDAPIVPSRGTRVVALDDESAPIVRSVAERPWANARFYTYDNGSDPNDAGASVDDLELRKLDGSSVTLGDELVTASVTVMVAMTDRGAHAAARIGMACSLRGIMTAGLIMGDGDEVTAALSALRPHARVLMVPADEDDLTELLTALRA